MVLFEGYLGGWKLSGSRDGALWDGRSGINIINLFNDFSEKIRPFWR